jgi:predicted NACHT family NTPase
LSDFLKQGGRIHLSMLVEFMAQRLAAYGFQIRLDDLEKLLDAGSCCLLFDGLDEVSTDQGRAAVSRLLEDCMHSTFR